MKIVRKICLLILLITIGLVNLSACGKKDDSSDAESIKNPVQQEVDLGQRLEDKANDAVENQGSQAQENDEKLDTIGGE